MPLEKKEKAKTSLVPKASELIVRLIAGDYSKVPDKYGCILRASMGSGYHGGPRTFVTAEEPHIVYSSDKQETVAIYNDAKGIVCVNERQQSARAEKVKRDIEWHLRTNDVQPESTNKYVRVVKVPFCPRPGSAEHWDAMQVWYKAHMKCLRKRASQRDLHKWKINSISTELNRVLKCMYVMAKFYDTTFESTEHNGINFLLKIN